MYPIHLARILIFVPGLHKDKAPHDPFVQSVLHSNRCIPSQVGAELLFHHHHHARHIVEEHGCVMRAPTDHVHSSAPFRNCQNARHSRISAPNASTACRRKRASRDRAPGFDRGPRLSDAITELKGPCSRCRLSFGERPLRALAH
jgi:hypothetical protein